MSKIEPDATTKQSEGGVKEDIQKIIADFGELLKKYQELPNRTCLYDRSDITYMQMYFVILVQELERLDPEKQISSDVK